jgi:TolB-like protein/Tfp pilus assembly protein PilF
MAGSTKTVFLSYAREDAVSAQRVADALRDQGIEVWFDQAALRGGDAWDQKIRRQIRECALFVPVISAATQARGEGYFRREWKLGVERTHDMASSIAFIVPLVIDRTPESDAMVPEEFMRYHWTRLAEGAPADEFARQVRRLIDSPREAASSAGRSEALAAAPSVGDTPPARPPAESDLLARTGVPGWTVGKLAAVIIGVAVALVIARLVQTLRPPDQPVTVAAKPPADAPAPAAVNDKSIAVLPFANLSSEKENEFFADGVHDDVITSLAKIRDLKVISRTSVLAYRDPASRNLKKIAAELGVATILEGSVRRVGTKVHMNAQLIDARTDDHLWAETYDGDATDIFALQAKLAQQIAAALKATLTPGEKTLIERRPTGNQEAYDLYLRARAMNLELGEQGTRDDFERVIGVYDQAIARDPSFALAHAQEALLHSVMYWFGFLDPTPERAARMKTEVDAAVRLAPEAPETHLALGAYHYRVERDWTQALAEFRIAETGLPNDAQLYFWLAITHRRLGHWTEALGYFEHSVSLNPRDLAPVTNFVQYLADLRRWDQVGAVSTRFLAYFPANHDLVDTQARMQFALTGDRAAYARALAALPRQTSDLPGIADLYLSALWAGDYSMASRTLAASPSKTMPERGSTVIIDPVALHLAFLAFLRGDPAAARSSADQAIDFYRKTNWNLRQQPWVRMRIAMAEAWSGRRDEALRDGPAALAEMSGQDAFDAAILREMLGEIQVALGQTDEAFAGLRTMMKAPCVLSPNEIRFGPLWSRLNGDPRFEEILQSAKPL